MGLLNITKVNLILYTIMNHKNVHVFNDEDEEDVEGVESEGSCGGGDTECENRLCPDELKMHNVVSRIRQNLMHFI